MKELPWLLLLIIIISVTLFHNDCDYWLEGHLRVNDYSHGVRICHGLVGAAKGKKKVKDLMLATPTAAGLAADTARRNFIPNREHIMSTAVAPPVHPCDETNSQNWMVYCQGELLHAVSLLDIYKDPKTFVDKPLKKDPEAVVSEFQKKFPAPLTINDREALRTFVEENFAAEGTDIEQFVSNQSNICQMVCHYH